MRTPPPGDPNPYADDDLLPTEFPNSVPEHYLHDIRERNEQREQREFDEPNELSDLDEGEGDEAFEEVIPVLPIDPVVVYVMLIVVAILGAGSLRGEVRFTILWTVLAAVAVLSLIVDEIEVERPALRDMLLGLGYGAMIGLPILAVTAGQLRAISASLFGELSHAAAFQTLAFTMPLAETLFFRGVFQGTRGLILATGAASLWTILLLFPALNVLQFPLVALVLAVAMVFINFVYSYLRERFSLFAAWSCQIALNLSLLFLSRFVG
jgi:membrane protease YdiL (CAAX protease family)